MHGEQLEPVRPIRALLRGLEALHALNKRDGLTVTEVADRARLPRTTAYRILETLRHGGFVVRDDMDDRYRPTLQVRGLAEGAESEAWIHQGAAPIVTALGKSLLWPVGLWTLDGNVARLRLATDRTSPLALVRKVPGEAAPVCRTGAGLVLLAGEQAEQRRAIAAAVGVERDFTVLDERLNRVREAGYAFDAQVNEGEIGIAVPVSDGDGQVIAAASVRVIRSALNDQRILGEVLPQLSAAARQIEAETLRLSGATRAAPRRGPALATVGYATAT